MINQKNKSNLLFNNKDYKTIFIWFSVSRLILLFLAWFLSMGDFKSVFYYFDVEHYYYIATSGYRESITAFFPIVPLMIKFFNCFGIPILGTMIVNNVLTLASACLLYKMTNNLTSAKLFLCSPIAVFTFIAYTESIFVFFTLLTIYLYKKEKYFAAGIILGCGVMTRSLAAMLFFAIFIVMAIKFFKKEISLKPIFQMYIPATLISLIYPVFLQIEYGNWKLFMDIQFKAWARISSNLISTIMADITFLSLDFPMLQKMQVIYQFILLGLMIALLICSILKIRKTKDEVTAIAILYLILSIFSIYSTCRIPEIAIPSASFYRYFYGCISVYLLPTIFQSEKFENIKTSIILTADIFFAICFATFYFLESFMC